MSDVAIQAAGLGKLHLIGTKSDSTLFKRIASLVAGSFNTKPLWALRGVDLQVQRGECLGVIGPNGAGKTTLLMLLAGVIVPTEGSVVVRGKVSPFFDIASGLHSELTVLDNIQLAAALFGMTRDQLRRRLDSIVAFAELEEYLYARLGELSVGYQSRVAFTTALHSDIDILLTDEVFSVGDAAFHSKSLARMSELLAGGRTVVLASHSMDLIAEHCTRVVYLERGRLVSAGAASVVIPEYLARHGLPPARLAPRPAASL